MTKLSDIPSSNGEKRMLWRLLEIAVMLIGGAATVATAINVWAVKDYLDFKATTARRWEEEAKRDTRQDVWIRWQSKVLIALAKEHKLSVPDPPTDLFDDDDLGGRR